MKIVSVPFCLSPHEIVLRIPGLVKVLSVATEQPGTFVLYALTDPNDTIGKRIRIAHHCAGGEFKLDQFEIFLGTCCLEDSGTWHVWYSLPDTRHGL